MEEVNIDSPDSNWGIVENANKFGSIPIKFTPSGLQSSKELMEITIPYFEGIDFELLNKIIDDNQLQIQGFRASINMLIDGAKKSGKDILEIKNDLVRPQVEKLEMQFKRLNEQHSLKVAGASLVSISAVLVSFASVGVVPAIGAALAGAASLLGLENDHNSKHQGIEENPLYFLWQMKKAKNQS